MLTCLYFQTLLLKHLQFERFDGPILINIISYNTISYSNQKKLSRVNELMLDSIHLLINYASTVNNECSHCQSIFAGMH
jgi:hypothetical protein